jgi:hypothetical protein
MTSSFGNDNYTVRRTRILYHCTSASALQLPFLHKPQGSRASDRVYCKVVSRPRRNHYYHLLSLISCLVRNHTAGVGSTVLKSFLETGFPGMTAYLPHFFLPWLYRSAYL